MWEETVAGEIMSQTLGGSKYWPERHCETLSQENRKFSRQKPLFADASPAHYKKILRTSILEIWLRNLCFAILKWGNLVSGILLNFHQISFLFRVTLPAIINHYCPN